MNFNLLASSSLGSMVLFGVMIVALIGLMVWQSVSGKKKQKEAQNMVDSLKKGDRVKTIGGICGFVVEINNEENTFVLETGTEEQKSYVKFDKGAIYQTAPHEGSANVKEEPKPEEVKEDKPQQEKEVKTAKRKAKKSAKNQAVKEEAKVEPQAEAEVKPEAETKE